ncbi:hypothetical protein C8A01DRAFT_15815 [Parachaetomium inaequale]|uniref:Uncharacterized protein n=1 Tax=Parachaetomium inaequale TaxID=2588326 RepID=A0AAN6PJH9_9PEZI|nr:hypothetical protein C8A01DRAFT_15815 [Parachaetomium inaequale]
MAATPFDIPAPGSSYAFDIYNDGHALRPPGPALPGGPCNYTDPSLPRCGCRRFWSRASLSSAVFQDNGALAEVCMCSHHACFHEEAQPGQTQPPPAMANAPGQENQKPMATRAPLSPVQLPSFHVPGSLGSSLDFNLLDFQASVTGARIEAAIPSPAEDAHAGQDSPMPDTFNNWGDLARSQAGLANGMPPFPAQCLMSPPPPPSTSASSQARYLRPFAGRGLHTLSGVPAPRPGSRRLERVFLDGGAEPAQDPRQDAASTPKAPPSQDRSVSSPDGAYQKLSDKVDSHEQRLDRLETNSFSIAGHDDCHDKHENVDLRVTELESRVDEVEKILNDNGSVVSSRRTAKQDGADDATASVVSVSTNATVLPSNRAEVYSQLQQLQAQVSQLQAAAMPSYAKPWELEVVFLPFPLKGVWLDSKEFANQRRSIGSNFEGWTQMPNTISRATPDPQSPKFQEWAGQGPESTWLLPRAFAAGRVIDQRLKSRGLIKTVQIRGADARSVQLAIHDAFEDVLRISSNSDARSGFAPEYPLAEFLGLRQAWVPLRKLHKDSRLRFLSPAEMATPALWDFTFLVSSVVMKATGVQRLYITQPEAYLQDHPLGYHALETGWTWQKLRQLSRVYPDSQSSADVPEADALEDCWNWNDRLDEPPSVAASAVSLRQSIHQRASRRSSTEPSGQFYTGVQSPILSTGAGAGPSRSRAQSPLIQRERKGSWPPHIRTGSLPPVHPAMLSPAQSRRRVSSHAAASATPYERRSSPFVPRASPRPSPRLGSIHNVAIPNATVASAAVPKRRFTRSPSLVPRNTPRWSRTSMSRSPSLAPGGLYGYHEEREREQNNNRERRTTTPFYYATPHSEAIPEYGYQRGGSRGPVAVPNGGLRMGGYDDGGDDLADGDYGDDGDEDMGDDFTTGSSGTGTGTDDDSEMTDHHQHHQHNQGYHLHHHSHHPHQQHQQHYNHHHHNSSARRTPGPSRQIAPGTGSFGFGGTDGGDEADLDLDIDVYEDEEDEDELDGVDTDHAPGQNDKPRNPRRAGGGGDGGGGGQQEQAPLRPEDIPWAGIEDAIANGGGGGIADGEGEDSNMSDGENVDPTSQSSQSQTSRSEEEEEGVEIAIHEDEDQLLGMGVGAGMGMGMGHMHVVGGGQQQEEDEVSSQAPSEYSSRPGAWQIVPSLSAGAAVRDDVEVVGMGQQKQQAVGGVVESSVMGFRIHEDGTAGGQGVVGGDGEEELLDTQWG